MTVKDKAVAGIIGRSGSIGGWLPEIKKKPRAVAKELAALDVAPIKCKQCGKPVEQKPGRGRLRRTCDDRCRSRLHYDRKGRKGRSNAV